MAISLVYLNDREVNGYVPLGIATFDMTHAGQESHFLAISDGNDIIPVTGSGTIDISRLDNGPKGYAGIGRTSSRPDVSPTFSYCSSMGNFCMAFDGYLSNGDKIRQTTGGKNDADVVARFIADANDFEKGMENAANAAKGHYCVNVLTEGGDAYSAVSPLMVRVLTYGKGENGSAVVSESRALSHIDMNKVRDLEPGEIAQVDSEGMHTLKKLGGERKVCSFLWPYYVMPESTVLGVSAALVRERIGMWHGQRDKEEGYEIDVCCPVPDSGKDYPEGYSAASGRPHSEILKKYAPAGRSYDRPGQGHRDLVASVKLTVIPHRAKGKSIVVLDDSTRRGTQLGRKKGPIRLLQDAGAREIHLRVCSPRNTKYCRCSPPEGGCYKDDELAANRFPEDRALAEYLGVNSVRFIDLDPFLDCITEGSTLTRDDLCTGCYTGEFGFLE